ncbi:VTT domain-containing protein [Limosilactobacillus vaginalis]|uniref:VTT domain-containing protein n=2 Tax=Limosilactobacillus vaginalis TaxID=1633 RepID=A0AAW5WRB8_9LACO|nr:MULTISPECIES: VTT domain-containing protein [Limosilactobacillus]PEH05351.1 cytochrome O ubiquinol oxidase [Lactobacillus sp. UMNPBX5]EEJ40276.1 SNARE-like domain protein [Limosilactobacillus vaginalis DSM 5837 = ATCC 49540]KRM44257.1 DedA family protein [Limosilactobacillus vaginalis DSM 5837 = ATCC 49540]MCI6853605.1 VTT domain-containing protein [Limosilactobacillus vaginalis]MCZ3666989.1 VTT domain-containing protein [Limosilactobacillus vaginalis]
MANLLYILTHIAEVIIPMFEWLGPWSYVLLFMIIFMETGLVIFPWLPGESLIFLTASFIAFHPVLKMEIVIPVFFLAAFIGDTVNYFIGRSLSRWQWLAKRVNGPGMVKAHQLLEKHGIKTIAFGRFVPLIRTFVPLIAGTMHFDFRRFMVGNLLGVIVWVLLASVVGYYFGSIPFVKEHFSLIILIFVAAALLVIATLALIRHIRRKILKRNNML